MDKPNVDIHVTADGANNAVLIGKDVVNLKDFSTFTFKTDEIEAFVEYCKALEASEKSNKTIYYGSKSVKIINADTKDLRNLEPAAECAVNRTPFVDILLNAEGFPFPLPDFEEFLFTLRPFIGEKGLNLYSYVRNFSASKVTSVKRETDNKGNFNYQIVREKGGATDVEIPETLTITIPVVTEQIFKSFTFDVHFSWKDNDNGCQVIFKLKNPLLGIEVEHAIRDSLTEVMTELKSPKYWGSLDKVIKDNKWMYVFNGLNN